MPTPRHIFVTKATPDEINRALVDLIRWLDETLGYGQATVIANNLTVLGDVTAEGATLSDLTATRLVATSAAKRLTSVAALISWITGTTNQITVTDDGDGTVTLSAPQDLHTGASPSFASLTLTGKVAVVAQDNPTTVLHGMGNV